MRKTLSPRALGVLVVVLATALSLLPMAPAAAAPTIELLNPSGYRTPMIVSDESDANNAIHLVAWAGEVPADAQVEFEVTQGLDQVTLTGVPGGTDSWSANFIVPGTYTDGQLIIRAILYSGQTEVARSPDKVVTLNSATPPPQSDSLEITHPENGGSLGFFTPKGKATNAVIQGTASEGTVQARVLYTTSRPGIDPVWKHCGGDPVSGGSFAARCTLVDGDTAGAVTAVAAVANRTPPPAVPNAAGDETGDAHRVLPYVQVPTLVELTPPSTRVNPTTCHITTATFFDQSNQVIAGLNVDVHAQGPDDQVKFASLRGTSSAYDPPDKAHGGTELAAKCAATDDETRQGEHSVPVGDDIKHIESRVGTTNLGQFIFVLKSDTLGGTQVSAWGDVDDDDTRNSGEASGGSVIGWGENPPPPQEEISIDPSSATATVGDCQVFTVSVRANNAPVPGANVDVHVRNPSGVSFCSGSLRSPDAGGHTGDSHADGTLHGEAETDGTGAFQFGVRSTAEGETTIGAWIDKTEDDTLTGEAATGASVTWQQVGDRSISLDANKRRARRGSRVRFFGSIEAAGNCASNQAVVLQAKPLRGGRFQRVARTRTDSQGDYSVNVVVRKSRKYRASTPRNGVCDAARSNNITVRATR